MATLVVVVATQHDGQVRLGLRVLAEGDRLLGADHRALADSEPQGRREPFDDPGVAAAYWPAERACLRNFQEA